MRNFRRPLAALSVSLALFFPAALRAQVPEVEPELDIKPNVQESKVPDVANGDAIAHKLCVGCHVVDKQAASPPPQADVPSFTAVATRANQSLEGLTTWLLAPHAPMPDPHLSRVEIRDLAGYIMSLKTAP
jgi:mono/diheme cytochrome c family protein